MSNKIRFSKKDIGAELLTILTTGLYRDTLDTLREYIQNSIDASSSEIFLKITPDTIIVDDNGSGMTEEVARHAIRLGISDKNPIQHVGFRGIGIYSAFNLCNNAVIYTKSTADNLERKITFNYKNIREELAKEQERRKAGYPAELYLEKVLEESVYIEDSQDNVIKKQQGTKIIISELLDEAYRRVNDWDEVTNYLQEVVPLPFANDFKFKSSIEKKLRQKKYNMIKLTLAIGDRKEEIFKPYYNEMFTNGGFYEPEFVELDSFGFAWIVINDARTVLRDKRLRGLLIKKAGFSISNRSYLEAFFPRVVFNRRISGELIIESNHLIPNAARSDFEHNSTREAFIRALPKFINTVSKWANEIQEEEKAKEVLAEVYDELVIIKGSLIAKRRDPEELLKLNVQLANLKDALKHHEKRLEGISADKMKTTKDLLADSIEFIRAELSSSSVRKKNLEARIAKAASALPKEVESTAIKYDSITSLLDAFGLLADNEMKNLIQFIDSNIMEEYLEKTQYQSAIKQIKEYLEDKS